MAKTYKKISGTWEPIKKIYKKVSGTWEEVKKTYKKVSGAWQVVHVNTVLVDNNIDAYAASDAGYVATYADKGDLILNGSGVLQAADGSRLGKLMDVWFTSDVYALNASQFIHECYAKSDENRVSDNKDWLYGTYSTGSQHSTDCTTCCGSSTYDSCACDRDVYYNNYAWR